MNTKRLKRLLVNLPWWLRPIRPNYEPKVIECPKSNNGKHRFIGYKTPWCRWCGTRKDKHGRVQETT